jgi:Domain of unknown function (DUF4203)
MKDLSNASPYILSLIGILFCFTGHKIIKALICLAGFLIGAAALGALANHYTQGNTLMTLGAALLGGLLIAGLALGVFKAGVFLLGFLAGAAVGTLFTGELLIIGLVGIVTGITTLAMQKYMLTVTSAIFGAVALIYSIYLIQNNQVLVLDTNHFEAIQYYLQTERYLMPATAALAGLGIYIQVKSMRKKD